MKEINLPSGRSVFIKPITLKTFRRFVTALDDYGLADGEASNSAMLGLLMDGLLDVVESATDVPKSKLDEMDPNDYMVLAKAVLEECSSFLASMGE